MRGHRSPIALVTVTTLMLLAITVHFHDAWGYHTFSAWVSRVVGRQRRLQLPALSDARS